MGRTTVYTEDDVANTPDSGHKKTTVYPSKEIHRYLGGQEIHKQLTNKNKTLKIPYDAMKSSKNAKVQEIVEKLEDVLTLEKVALYNEVHSEWEDSGVWG
jgi:hypothetical protein